MSKIPNLKELVLRDTPFASLMQKRVYNVLLIATKYDAFMLEDDGHVDWQIFNEYNSLGLRYPPRFTQVTTEEEAMVELADRHFELIIVMPNMDNRDTFATARNIKHHYPLSTIVVLTPWAKEVSKRFEAEDLTGIDYVFSWLGNADLLLAIIKLIEDKWNAENDSHTAGVQNILLVEDSVRFYSSALPYLYGFVLKQSLIFSEEALNDQLKTMRMRGRPKILLARNYEEAVSLFDAFGDNILGVISDMSFPVNGKKETSAGVRLGQHIKKFDRHIPIIFESSEDKNSGVAAQLGASFISKNSKTYPQDLRAEIMEHFGFGDFIVIDPSTRAPIMKISTLHDLQQNIWKIPEASLVYHLERNHFSRFFYSRAMFPPAVVLKKIDVADYENLDQARKLIFDLIVEYRHMKNEGVVAEYQRNRFDEYASFARIGKGSLGGKGRGLAFMSAMVRRYPRLSSDNFLVTIPKTVVISTDIFDEFMETNRLYPIALSGARDEQILEAFQHGKLPERVRDDLLSLLKVVMSPLAVRSSSLLEDSHYQPFAGIYSTYMIPNLENHDAALKLLNGAIKAVYASVFYQASKNYLTATQNLIDQEKMAVVIQEVVGSFHNNHYYPTMSGVARSLNFYPIGNEKPEDGVADIALGLGKYIVDGGRSLRFSPRHPRHILQLSAPELALRETQTKFLALDIDKQVSDFEINDGFNLAELNLKDAENEGTLKDICSTYDVEDNIIRPGYEPLKRKIISFQHILQYDRFPVCNTIDKLLEIGRKEMGRNIEIEFAVNIDTSNTASFYLLQMRPIVDAREQVDEDLTKINPSETIIMSENVLGNGIITDIYDIVYVRPESFGAENNPQIANEISNLNTAMQTEGRGYILVGPGRWGSSDPWLGIPIKYHNISQARIIVECGLEKYRVDPSQGTHFFQNITSLGIGYFTINPFRGEGTFDTQYLNSLPALHETKFLRHIRLANPLVAKMDGRRGLGVVLK